MNSVTFCRFQLSVYLNDFYSFQDSGRWSLNPGDEYSSGFVSYNSQPDVQVFSLDLLGQTPPCCFEGEIKPRNISPSSKSSYSTKGNMSAFCFWCRGGCLHQRLQPEKNSDQRETSGEGWPHRYWHQ